MDLLAHFGMHKTPFTREIETDELLGFPFADEAFDGLLQAVSGRMSGALIGPAGTGKTALLRRLRDALPEARYHVRYVKVTSLSKRDICREIAAACGLPPAGTYPSLVRKLQQHWDDGLGTDGVRPVLVLDEAQDLRPDVLAILRILTNFDYDSRLVLSVVLAGQPPLATMLSRDDLDAVARRLAHYATLRLLSRDETTEYIEHRCAIAGAATVPLDAGAIDAIYEMSRGNLRAIDRLGLKSLEIAAARDVETAGSVHVAQARKQLWP
jgi:general secretion pathway protein A